MKHALKGKAIEHKVREAKALGQNVDPELLSVEYDENMSSTNHENNTIVKERPEVIRPMQLPIYDPNVQLSLKLDLAMNIAQSGKLFIDLKEETFEDGQDGELNEDFVSWEIVNFLSLLFIYLNFYSKLNELHLPFKIKDCCLMWHLVSLYLMKEMMSLKINFGKSSTFEILQFFDQV